jgi:hypothetical protein
LSVVDIPDRTCTRHGCVEAAHVWVEIDGTTRVVCEKHADDADVVIRHV